jgi:hypothetical protein
VLLVPSPKLQAQVLILPVEASENCTDRGAEPALGVALKAARGRVTVTELEALLSMSAVL